VTPSPIRLIGVIGAIGAGKSTASASLAKSGGRVIDADKLGHRGLELPEVKRELVHRWGERVLKEDGTIDRRAIAGIVFESEVERKALESIVYPPIGLMAEVEIAKAAADPEVRFVVLDASMLLEAGWQRFCEKIIYVDAPRELRLTRLADRSGWSPEEVARREAAQLPAEKKKAFADVVVMNDGSTERLQEQIDELVEKWELR